MHQSSAAIRVVATKAKAKHTRDQKLESLDLKLHGTAGQLSASKPAEVFDLLLEQWHPQLVFCCVVGLSGMGQHRELQLEWPELVLSTLGSS